MIKPGKSGEHGMERQAHQGNFNSQLCSDETLSSRQTLASSSPTVPISLIFNKMWETEAVEQRDHGTNLAFNITLAICFPNLMIYSLEETGRYLERRLSGYSAWHASMRTGVQSSKSLRTSENQHSEPQNPHKYWVE